MKVAIIDPSGFTPPYDHHLCTALQENDVDVRLYTSATFPHENDETSYRIVRSFYRVTDKRIDSNGQIGTALKGIEHVLDTSRLVGSLLQWDPDVIHFQWLPLPFVDEQVLPLLRRIAPLVHTVHDTTPFHNSSTSAVQLWRAKAVRERFDRLVTHTEQGRADLEGDGIDREKITVIPHSFLHYDVDSSLANTRISESSADLRVLFFGTLKPYKGVDVLLRAFGALPPSIQSRAELYIAGRAKMDLTELRSLVERLGIESNVVWDVRFIPDSAIPALVRSADIIALPYRSIDQSGVLMTILPYEVPIVATDVGGFSETLTDGEHGRLVPPDDPGSFEEALETLLESPAMREEMRRKLGQLTSNIPSWDAIAERTAELYQSVVVEEGSDFEPAE